MKEENKKEDKKELLEKGKAAGAGLTLVGAGALAAGNLEKLGRLNKYASAKWGPEVLAKESKKARIAGSIAIPAGIALTGYSHYKSKKDKNDNSKKEK